MPAADRSCCARGPPSGQHNANSLVLQEFRQRAWLVAGVLQPLDNADVCTVTCPRCEDH